MTRRPWDRKLDRLGTGLVSGLACISLISCLLAVNRANAVGLLPIPNLADVTVEAQATYNPDTRWYTYDYVVGNGAASTGEIWQIKIDVQQSPRYRGGFDAEGLMLPYGTADVPFSDMLAQREPLNLPPGSSVVPFGQRVPTGWVGGFGRDGYASFATLEKAANILPAATQGGFKVISPGVPTIRSVQAIPDWVLVVEDHDEVTETTLDEAAAVEEQIRYHTHTLGPSGLPSLGSHDHWSQLAADIDTALDLGWISDTSLADAVKAQLAMARTALDADDGTLAKERLHPILDLLAAADAGQRSREAHDLIALNVQSLIDHTPDTPISFEPAYRLIPPTAERAIGDLHTVTARVVNTADDDAPVSGYLIYFSIIDGPHAWQSRYGWTDAEGEVQFQYQGTSVGTDHIIISELLGELHRLPQTPIMLASVGPLSGLGLGIPGYPNAVAEATTTWVGGADLVVPMFMPPIVRSEGGRTVFITEDTANFGNLTAGESVTRYYLSSYEQIDPGNDRVIGQRLVEVLEPEATSTEGTLKFTIPGDLPEGTYYLAACADAEDMVAELDESNNCSFSQLDTVVSNIEPMEQITNLPPNCSEAVARPSLLWPPDHELAQVAIEGVQDPENDPITLQVLRIQQDEPVNGLGDGDIAPDGFGIGTSQAKVRKERSGLDNGRVYLLDFKATDTSGESCAGTVSVGVPHDEGAIPLPIDDGLRYDSTLP